MKKNYQTPLIEVVELEIEDAVLSLSNGGSVEDFSIGKSWGDEF